MKKISLLPLVVFGIVSSSTCFTLAMAQEAAPDKTDTTAVVESYAPAVPDAPAGKLVKAIDIQGNKSIGIATILTKIKTRVGQEYRQAVISDDLKRLYNTGYFSDVRVDRKEDGDGLRVVIYVDEKPIVDEITFSKIRYYSKKVILSKIKTQIGKFLDKKGLNDDINTIKEL